MRRVLLAHPLKEHELIAFRLIRDPDVRRFEYPAHDKNRRAHGWPPLPCARFFYLIRLEPSNDFGAFDRIFLALIIHSMAGHQFIWIGNPSVEGLFIPTRCGFDKCGRIFESGNFGCQCANNSVQPGAEPVFAIGANAVTAAALTKAFWCNLRIC